MKYDDESLERALAALPLEGAPADLHGRILAATILRPAPVLHTWELWVVGIALAVAAWLTLAIVGSPMAGGPTEAHAIQSIVEGAGQALAQLIAPRTVLWIGAGGLAAFVFSRLGLPGAEIGTEA